MYTFVAMEKIIFQALEDSKTRTRAEFQRRALNAPPVDRHIEELVASQSAVDDEIRELNKDGSARIRTLVLVAMLGLLARWQILEDFVKEWVGHYGKGLNNSLKKDTIEILLSARGAWEIQKKLRADSRLYRNAIAHGGFRFVDDHNILFWTRDDRGKKHELPTFSSGDIIELNNRVTIRLRTMEALARVLRAWGRHSSVHKSKVG